MTINKLTDQQLDDLLTELEACGIYGRQVRALAELQQRREADKNCLLYGIVDCDGNAYIDECCVALAASQLDSVIDELNTEYEDGEYANDGAPYRVAALYTALPLTDSEREELQEYRNAGTPELKMANLTNKFYERYPLDGFKSDAERAAAAGKGE